MRVWKCSKPFIYTKATNNKGSAKANVSVLNKSTYICNNSMWCYADVMERANTHLASSHDNSGTWANWRKWSQTVVFSVFL